VKVDGWRWGIGGGGAGETLPLWGLIGQMADGAWNGWERT